MEDTLKFVPHALESTAEVLRSATAEIEALLAALDASSSDLRSKWAGQAEEAYTAALSSWSKEFAEMSAILSAAANAVASSKLDYEAAEKTNSERWRG